MTDELRSNRSRPLLALGAVVVVVVVGLSLPAGRALVGRFFRSLRMQKVQAVNVDLSSFTDPNANPALHQMVAQMISDKVVVTVNEQDQPASDASAATQLAGFPVQLLGSRKDAPKLVVSGAHGVNLTVDRARLQAIFTEAGHPGLVVPQSLDGAARAQLIPRALQRQKCTCPTPTTATNAIASNVTGSPAGSTQFSDCLRLRAGSNPRGEIPAGLC